MRRRTVLIGFTIALLAFATYIYFTVWRDPTTPFQSTKRSGQH